MPFYSMLGLYKWADRRLLKAKGADCACLGELQGEYRFVAHKMGLQALGDYFNIPSGCDLFC